MTLSRKSDGEPQRFSEEPRKAYSVTWIVTNEMQAFVYADSCSDAVQRVVEGHDEYMGNTGNDGRARRMIARREPDEDR